MAVKVNESGEPEFVVATAECDVCDGCIDRWCIPIEVDGETYPPQYLWRHFDGVVMCRWGKVATPREGTVAHV